MEASSANLQEKPAIITTQETIDNLTTRHRNLTNQRQEIRQEIMTIKDNLESKETLLKVVEGGIATLQGILNEMRPSASPKERSTLSSN